MTLSRFRKRAIFLLSSPALKIRSRLNATSPAAATSRLFGPLLEEINTREETDGAQEETYQSSSLPSVYARHDGSSPRSLLRLSLLLRPGQDPQGSPTGRGSSGTDMPLAIKADGCREETVHDTPGFSAVAAKVNKRAE